MDNTNVNITDNVRVKKVNIISSKTNTIEKPPQKKYFHNNPYLYFLKIRLRTKAKTDNRKY